MQWFSARLFKSGMTFLSRPGPFRSTYIAPPRLYQHIIHVLGGLVFPPPLLLRLLLHSHILINKHGLLLAPQLTIQAGPINQLLVRAQLGDIAVS